jgi:hypothetical protein
LSKPEKLKCPDCEKEYDDAAHLGIHRRAAHGILGTSAQAIKRRKEIADAKKAAAKAAQPPTKRKYTKRSNKLATLPQAVSVQSNHQTNGHGQTSGITPRRYTTEAALAVGFGQFKELCKNLAFEYDLPSRSFAAQLINLLHAETLR